MAKVKPKAPVGRPTDYKPEYCHLIKDHMAKGFSFESFAAIVDVSRETLYAWCRDFPEFSDACDRAKEKARFYWEETGIKGANGKIRNFNGGVWTFWMKNRFKWHDNIQVQQDLKVETVDKTKELAAELLTAMKAKLEIK